MDEEARYFLEGIEFDPWTAAELPVPGGLDVDGLRRVWLIVHAIIHALDCTLDECLPLIGRLVEIDRRLEAAQHGESSRQK